MQTGMYNCLAIVLYDIADHDWRIILQSLLTSLRLFKGMFFIAEESIVC